jgi:hypothetical protein
MKGQRGSRWRLVVNATSRPLYTQERDTVPTVQKAGWASGPVWTGEKNFALTGIRSLDRQARMKSLYRPRYLGPPLILSFRYIQHCSLCVTYFLRDTFLTSWIISKGSTNLLKHVELIKLLRLLQRRDCMCLCWHCYVLTLLKFRIKIKSSIHFIKMGKNIAS